MPTRRRRQVIHASDVNSAKEDLRERLEHPAPFVDEDGDPYWGPSVVCAATTWEDFKRWLNVNEGRLRRWDFEPLNDGTNRGRVVIYSLPSFVHEHGSDEIRSSITTQILIAGNNINLIDTVIGGRVTCQIGDSGQEPNASLTPVNLEVGEAVLAASVPKRDYRSCLQERKFSGRSSQTPAMDERRYVCLSGHRDQDFPWSND